MNARSLFLLVCGYSGLLLCAVGSQRGSLQAAPVEAVSVPISRPVAREVTDFVDFTGRTEAISSVNVVARVTGYLVKAPFREGAEVKQGDLLFEIDPRPYQAQCDVALAQVDLSKAQFDLARATLARDQQATRTTPGAVSAQQLDQDRATVVQAEAQTKVAQASLETYRLNLDFCKVTSPIGGRVSRCFLTPGNLVTQDKTVLTTVVSLDPMFACFDIDETSMLRVQQAIGEERTKPRRAGHIPVFMGLPSEEGFPHQGDMDFIDNQVNPTTGSVLVRGIFANPSPPGGPRLLMPGMFARIRLPIGQPHKALLVAERVVSSDQGRKYVYVVNARGEIERKPIETGSLESDGLRVVTKGLSADDQVVVSSLRQIHPGMKVQTKTVPMPLPVGRGGEEK